MKYQKRRPGIWLVAVLAMHCLIILLHHRVAVDAYHLPNSNSHSRAVHHKTLHQKSALLASRDTTPNPAASTARTSVAITKVASFRDDDRMIALQAFLKTTLQPLSLLITFSLTLAFGMVAWEDYGATNLWPSRHMVVLSSSSSALASSSSTSDAAPFGSKTIRGLGYGKEERLNTLQQDRENMLDNNNNNNNAASLLPEIRSYNEVMLEHRTDRVTRWQQQQQQQGLDATTQNNMMSMESAVSDLQDILRHVLELQSLAKDYQWDSIHATIRDSILPKLEPAATVLRVELSHNGNNNNNNNNNNKYYASGYGSVGYEDIGFDWGSCAWRHCGALADAQEALDELDHLLGVLEPPECLFCLDIVERSIRDMLAVVPPQYHALDDTRIVPTYQKYQSAHVSSSNEFGDDTDVLDQEYLRMLQELRSSGGEGADDGGEDTE